MQGLRKTAFVLAHLEEVDRAWMLGQIGEAERRQLEPLVDEARKLSLQFDAQGIGELLEMAERTGPPIRALDSASAVDIWDLLGSEPDWVVSAIVRARPWIWKEELLALLGPNRYARLKVALTSGEGPQPRLVEELLRALEAKYLGVSTAGFDRHNRRSGSLPARFLSKLRNGVSKWRE